MSTRSADSAQQFTVLDVGILILEAVAVLHGRGHQRVHILPGMSGSGMYWRTAVTHAGNFTDDGGYVHLTDFDAAFHYTTGAEFEVAGGRVDASTTADELADRILAQLPDSGKGTDSDYVNWYRDLMELVRTRNALPIAYADYFDADRGWEIGWGSGLRIQPPPRPHEEGQGVIARDVAEAAGADGSEDPAASTAVQLSNTHNSVAFELMLENVFLSELLQEMWFARGQVVDVLHSPVDAYGYDIVLQCDGVTRHVQLKTKWLKATTARYKLSTLLYNQPAACVVVLEWELPPGASRVALTYRWFGGGPHEAIPSLGDKLAKHTKGDSQGVKKAKPLHREVALGKFSKVSSMADVAALLFGPAGPTDGS